jgi:ubiquinone/menaquinone biosynthesis C-methylase UbiE
MIFVILALIFLSITTVVIWTSQRRAIPCPFWLSWLVELENPFTKNNRSKNIIQQLDVQPGMKVLDVGCGPGRLTIPLAETVGSEGKVIAIDIQQEMLTHAKNKAISRNLQNIDFLQKDISKKKLECQVDRAVLINVLGEIPDKEAALKEIFRALKPGGILCITEVIFDPHFQKREKVHKLTSKAGFREKKFFGNKLAFSLCLEKPK